MRSQSLVSIITVCLNSQMTIRKTIESIQRQTYGPIEYIIIDGGSTDDTLKIINEYTGVVNHLVSEPDKGISDAFNKGLKLAKGEFIRFLNADDVLPDNAIEVSVRILQENRIASFVFGDIKYVGTRLGVRGAIVKGDMDYRKTIHYVMPRLNHPTILARRILFELHGSFDIRWKVAMDYDWLLRIHRAGGIGVYDERINVIMEAGGLSDRNPFLAFRECRDISIEHGFNPVVAHIFFSLRCIKHILFVILRLR